MPYPIIAPVPISQSNPLICSIPGYGATATAVAVSASDVSQMVRPLNAIDGLADEDQDLLSYQAYDGGVQIYDPTTAFDAGTRAAMRSDLASEIFGTANAGSYIAFFTAENGFDVSAPEGDYWAMWCAASTAVDAADGSNDLASAFMGWLYQIWAKAWTDHVNAGIIDPSYAWLVFQRGDGPAFNYSVECYGPEPSDQHAWQHSTALSLIAQMQTYMTGGHVSLVTP